MYWLWYTNLWTKHSNTQIFNVKYTCFLSICLRLAKTLLSSQPKQRFSCVCHYESLVCIERPIERKKVHNLKSCFLLKLQPHNVFSRLLQPWLRDMRPHVRYVLIAKLDHSSISAAFSIQQHLDGWCRLFDSCSASDMITTTFDREIISIKKRFHLSDLLFSCSHRIWMQFSLWSHLRPFVVVVLASSSSSSFQ